jgi:hypothetical protein
VKKADCIGILHVTKNKLKTADCIEILHVSKKKKQKFKEHVPTLF